MNKNDFNILIVEDEFIAFAYLKNILEQMGFENILDAKNADNAKEIVFDKKIDLVFMDINIEGSIDGITCARLINEKDDIPIIYTTAYADINTINDTKETNIFGYIIKPFNYEDVDVTLSVAMRFLEKKNSTLIIDEEFLLTKDYRYYKNSKTLKKNGVVVNLTKKELEIFNQLYLKFNQNISYELLSSEVWEGKDVSLSTIRDTISRLKRKVPEINIENIPNYGYILKLDK
ncbi:MAG: response regulator [Campylobacteraceae bacterium]|nr:response regulator [Campylobacteraceae bacterium]